MSYSKDSQDFVLNNLVKRVEELFGEIDSDIATNLLHSNEEYSKLYYRLIEIQQQYPAVQKAVDGEGGVSLNKDEHKALIEYLRVYEETDSMERLEAYFQGHADCMAYLKRISAL
ncbi:DUF6664 family protein [Desulfotomaculum sp. 1211_IL3151]|uniref:DUF6664 family protein n=1 Tax=Desulfotomaculum sp. 1211_IL3151 TaxID=3084055 RepID=UPI002FD8EB99